MKAVIRISVNKYDTPTTVVSSTDYHVLVANIKGKGMDDIDSKLSRLLSQIEQEENATAMGATVLWNKELKGLGFMKYSSKNGFTGDFSKRDEDLKEFGVMYRS
jgi:hypothetical protein